MCSARHCSSSLQQDNIFGTYSVTDGAEEARHAHEKNRRPDLYLRYSIFLIVHEEWQLKSGHMLYPEEAWRGETHLAGSRQYRPVQEFCHHFQQKGSVASYKNQNFISIVAVIGRRIIRIPTICFVFANERFI